MLKDNIEKREKIIFKLIKVDKFENFKICKFESSH